MTSRPQKVYKKNRVKLKMEAHCNPLEELLQKRTDELALANRKLKRTIEEHARVVKRLYVSEDKFNAIFEHANDIICHTDMKGKVLDINQKVFQIFGFKPEEIIGTDIRDWDFLNPQDIERNANVCRNVRAGHSSEMGEIEIFHKDIPTAVIEINSKLIQKDGKATGVLHIIRDITGRKQAEKELRKHRDHLDLLVRERTSELQEVNTALKVLLKQREEDRLALEQSVLTNIREQIIPYIEKLKTLKSLGKNIELLNILESNINDMVSPFTHKLSNHYPGFTPSELQLANLIKLGKTTKEIAETLNSSIRAIEFHRLNIRAKLGLKNRKDNLRSYLLALD